MDGMSDSMGVSLSKLREIVKDRKPGMLQFMGFSSDMTEQQCHLSSHLIMFKRVYGTQVFIYSF